MNHRITITPAQASDAEGIAAVQYETWLATYPNDSLGITRAAIQERISNFRSPERIAKWRAIIKGQEYITVAKAGDQIIGFSGAKKDEIGHHIAALYVLPAYHGLGVAQPLMEAALNWLSGDRAILLDVAAYNQRAIAFYRKYGFRPTGQTGHSGIIPTLQMKRPAAPSD